MNEIKIRFPTFDEMSPDTVNKKFLKRLREKVRYRVYTALYRRQCRELVGFLNRSDYWDQLFKLQQYRFNSLLMVYCDKRFNVNQRLNAIIDNLNLFEHYLGADFSRRLLAEHRIQLTQLGDHLRLNFNLNRIDPFEGYFSINMDTTDGERIYDASFSFLAPNKLLIASVQGPAYAHAQDAIKQATKELHGVRPMFMLVNVFKMLAALWGCELLGIPHKYQGKYRLAARHDIQFNYDEFWQENDGIRQNDYWHLPTEIARKPLESIASKKRSMYRKRYDMFDRLAQQLPHVLNGGV